MLIWLRLECVLSFFFLCYHIISVKTDSTEKTLSPCQICKSVTNSFKKGFEQITQENLNRNDAKWEKEQLLKIQNQLCLGPERGDQCQTLAEKSKEIIEGWWFHKKNEEPDLYKYFCIDNLKSCCPEHHFGPDCTPCNGYPNVCFNNGRCNGSGTHEGNGQCICDVGYSGKMCSQCSEEYYESYRDTNKLLCSPCHTSCQGPCTQAGPKGCSSCKKGWVMNAEKVCYDINECVQEKTCKRNEFCINNEGSFSCLPCDRACTTCQGDGPDMCDECAAGFMKKDNLCINGSQTRTETQISITRYITYFGLCVATCIIFQKNAIIASVIGLAVALYISFSEYMLIS